MTAGDPWERLERHLASAIGIRGLARQLGRHCLEHECELLWLVDRYRDTAPGDGIVDRPLAAVPESHWRDIESGARPLAGLLLEPGVRAGLSIVATQEEIFELALLRALCVTGLTWWFHTTHAVVRLAQGDPFPLLERPLPQAFRPATPRLERITRGELLAGTGFGLHDRRRCAAIAVELDFTRREALDGVTCQSTPGRPFPRLASIHPYGSFDELEIAERRDQWWFGVRPRSFPLAGVLSDLRRLAREAEIAVLPELSLPAPDALADALRDDPTDYPPLVVAGSAHAERGNTRANVSEVYLEGVLLLRHRKIRPFVLIREDGSAWPEGLTVERNVIRVAASDRTRLAVAICADLNDRTIPGLLQAAGVNLLLVPALTPHEGAFNATASGLASFCQGITLVVNGAPPPPPDGSEPFMVLVGVPRPSPSDQLRSYPPPPSGRGRLCGRLDPNEALPAVLPW